MEKADRVAQIRAACAGPRADINAWGPWGLGAMRRTQWGVTTAFHSGDSIPQRVEPGTGTGCAGRWIGLPVNGPLEHELFPEHARRTPVALRDWHTATHRLIGWTGPRYCRPRFVCVGAAAHGRVRVPVVAVCYLWTSPTVFAHSLRNAGACPASRLICCGAGAPFGQAVVAFRSSSPSSSHDGANWDNLALNAGLHRQNVMRLLCLRYRQAV
jgi:hypothetical protein